MATLRVITETGFFHIACRLGYDDGRTKWAGWQPVKGGRYWTKEDVGRGWIEKEDKEEAGKVNHYVTFNVGDDSVLEHAEHCMVRDYVVKDDTYGFGTRDCVSFVRDVARYCGLRVNHPLSHPVSRIDFLPYELLYKLHELNEQEVIEDQTDLF